MNKLHFQLGTEIWFFPDFYVYFEILIHVNKLSRTRANFDFLFFFSLAEEIKIHLKISHGETSDYSFIRNGAMVELLSWMKHATGNMVFYFCMSNLLH